MELDASGQDPALRRMVIIGHSQGGLLAKLMTIGSGRRFWDAASTVPFDEVEMPAETRKLLREGMFFGPVPTVERVVFIATPYRGSYRATGYVLNLIRRIVRYLRGKAARFLRSVASPNKEVPIVEADGWTVIFDKPSLS